MTGGHDLDPQRTPRKDTARNRQALINAAREAFATDGFGVPLEPIATAAGLGNATLYRHFPTRAALWEAVLVEPMREILTVATASTEIEDAWEALQHYLVGVSALEAHRGGFTTLMTTHFADAPALIDLRSRIQDAVDTLVSRALATEAIRSDVTETDFAVIAVAIAEITRTTRSVAPNAWRRHLGLVMDGLRTPAPSALGAPPLKRNQIWRALMRRR